MVSAHGSSKYSNIVALTSNRKGVDIISISPNPVINGTFNLDLFSNATASVEISITDMQGRVVEHRKKNVTSGINSIGFNVPYLAAGTYTISVTTEKDKSRVLRFVKE